MAENGRKWSKMAGKCRKWSKMVDNGRKWLKMIENGRKCTIMVENGRKWSKIAENWPKIFNTTNLNSFRMSCECMILTVRFRIPGISGGVNGVPA
jgi:hypothetical protein